MSSRKFSLARAVSKTFISKYMKMRLIILLYWVLLIPGLISGVATCASYPVVA